MLDEILDIVDVSFTLRAVETTIGILASTGGDPNMLLRKYLTDILRMNEHECLASGKVLLKKNYFFKHPVGNVF